jgi:hypothetical protein
MPNEKGNRYAIHVLKDRRATMAGEIVQMKEGIAYREEQLTHLDAVLRELDPSYTVGTLVRLCDKPAEAYCSSTMTPLQFRGIPVSSFG